MENMKTNENSTMTVDSLNHTIGYGMIPNMINLTRSLSSNEKSLLRVLCMYAGNSEITYPKLDTLMLDLDWGTARMTETMRSLIDRGVIAREYRYKYGRNRTKVTQLNLDSFFQEDLKADWQWYWNRSSVARRAKIRTFLQALGGNNPQLPPDNETDAELKEISGCCISHKTDKSNTPKSDSSYNTPKSDSSYNTPKSDSSYNTPKSDSSNEQTSSREQTREGTDQLGLSDLNANLQLASENSNPSLSRRKQKTSPSSRNPFEDETPPPSKKQTPPPDPAVPDSALLTIKKFIRAGKFTTRPNPTAKGIHQIHQHLLDLQAGTWLRKYPLDPEWVKTRLGDKPHLPDYAFTPEEVDKFLLRATQRGGQARELGRDGEVPESLLDFLYNPRTQTSRFVYFLNRAPMGEADAIATFQANALPAPIKQLLEANYQLSELPAGQRSALLGRTRRLITWLEDKHRLLDDANPQGQYRRTIHEPLDLVRLQLKWRFMTQKEKSWLVSPDDEGWREFLAWLKDGWDINLDGTEESARIGREWLARSDYEQLQGLICGLARKYGFNDFGEEKRLEFIRDIAEDRHQTKQMREYAKSKLKEVEEGDDQDLAMWAHAMIESLRI